MYKLVGYDGSSFEILDTSDAVSEFIPVHQIRVAVEKGLKIEGIELNLELNPIYTIDGLEVEIQYPCSYVFGSYKISVLRKGERYGRTLSSFTDKLTVFIYQYSERYRKWLFVTSYYYSDFINHRNKLVFDGSQPSWCLEKDTMLRIIDTLKLSHERGDF